MMQDFFFCQEEHRWKIEDYLIQWIGIASLVDAAEDIINFLSPPLTWMHPVAKNIV